MCAVESEWLVDAAVVSQCVNHLWGLLPVVVGLRSIHTLAGHHGEISSTQYDYRGETCISGSIDRTCKIWDIGTGQCIKVSRDGRQEAADTAILSCRFRCIPRRCVVTMMKSWMFRLTPLAARYCISLAANAAKA